MALDFQNSDAQRSLDKQQILDWQRGWQVINPANGDLLVTAGAGNFDYDIADGDVNAGGTTVSVSGESVDFTNDIDANDDQIAVIYIDASGNAQKEIGPKGTRDPSGDDIRSTHTPAAPSMHSTNGVVLAEVLLPAGASSIGSTELRDRRLPAELVLDSLDAVTVAADDLGITNAIAVYELNADISVANNTLTDIDDWTVAEDEIGSISAGDTWSPNNDGRYLVIVKPVFTALSGSDTESRVTISGHQIATAGAREGNIVSHGNKTSYEATFIVDMTSTQSVSFDIIHQSGSSETLDATNTLLRIVRVG